MGLHWKIERVDILGDKEAEMAPQYHKHVSYVIL
jgi:hypothetical protein